MKLTLIDHVDIDGMGASGIENYVVHQFREVGLGQEARKDFLVDATSRCFSIRLFYVIEKLLNLALRRSWSYGIADF